MSGRPSTTTKGRFYARASLVPGSDCIIWIGKRDKRGYGRVQVNCESSYLAHRLAYELLVGPIPKGFQVHHECGNRACVNPNHLAAIDSKAHAAEHAVASCIHGHVFDASNTRIIKGSRHCRACDARRAREYRARLRVAA